MKIPQAHRTILVCVSVGLLCILTLSVPCAAQKVASSVTVVVTDQLGAVLVGAEIRVASATGGELLKTLHTDKEGRASASLWPGDYDLFVTESAFRSATTRISVTASTPQTTTIRLYVGPPEKQGGSRVVPMWVEMASALPERGVVPDEQTAIAIAEAVFEPVFPADDIAEFRPYHAQLDGDVWTVYGTRENGSRSGAPQLRINKSDGKVLRIGRSRSR